MDEPAFTGCLVPSRLVGIIEAEQTENGKTTRNDRLVAVPSNSHTHTHIRSLKDLNATLVEQMEHFFISYNEAKGKKFRVLGHFGAQKAAKLVRSSIDSNGK
jgi:inorganic pyrophosphatase